MSRNKVCYMFGLHLLFLLCGFGDMAFSATPIPVNAPSNVPQARKDLRLVHPDGPCKNDFMSNCVPARTGYDMVHCWKQVLLSPSPDLLCVEKIREYAHKTSTALDRIPPLDELNQ